MSKTILVLSIILSAFLGIALIFTAVYIDSTVSTKGPYHVLLITIFSSVGGTVITAVLVALTIEWYSFLRFEKIIAIWNNAAGKAALSGIVGTVIPDEITEGLIKTFSKLRYLYKNFSCTFRIFENDNNEMFCSISANYNVENIKQKKVVLPLVHDYLKGLLPDQGDSIKFDLFRIADNSGNIYFEETNCEFVEDKDRVFFIKKITIPPKKERIVDTLVTFKLPSPSYSTFITFQSPTINLRISVETNIRGMELGVSGNSFWVDKLFEEVKQESSVTVRYRGIAFAGQAIGLWAYRQT